jgi:hypothetical protein
MVRSWEQKTKDRNDADHLAKEAFPHIDHCCVLCNILSVYGLVKGNADSSLFVIEMNLI